MVEPVSDRLPDEAYVVRGGRMESRPLWVNARDHHAEFPNEWAISASSVAGWSSDAIALAAPFRNRDMRVATVGAVRSLGHDVVPSDEPPHADILLGCEPSEEVWEALRGVFGPTEPNPRYEEEV